MTRTVISHWGVVKSPVKNKRLTDRVSYLPGLDGLRGCAAVGVFMVHWQQKTGADFQGGSFSLGRLCESGRYGVAMFLLLTGYCLAAPLWRSPVDERLERTLRGFWSRRAARLLPLYWSLLLAITLTHDSVFNPDALRDLAVHMLFIHNWWQFSLYSISEPLWAIAVIGQYYLFFWLLIRGLKKVQSLSDRALFFAFATVLLVSWTTCIATAATGFPDTFGGQMVWNHSLLVHLPIFVSGAIAAAWVPAPQPVSRRHAVDIAALGCSVLLVLLFSHRFVTTFEIAGSRYGFPVIPMMMVVLILAAISDGWFARLCSSTVPRTLGSISLGIYLIHSPMLNLLGKLPYSSIWMADRPFVFGAAALVATCVAAWLWTLFVEHPIRRSLIAKDSDSSNVSLASAKKSV